MNWIKMLLALGLLLSGWGLSTAAQAQDAEQMYCVSHCVSRTINLQCLNYGRDFCAPHPEAACIPHCVQRSVNGMCMNYGWDFCAIAPECTPSCNQRTVNGMCLSYGPDACFGY